jgi:hypothetical protein
LLHISALIVRTFGYGLGRQIINSISIWVAAYSFAQRLGIYAVVVLAALLPIEKILMP